MMQNNNLENVLRSLRNEVKPDPAFKQNARIRLMNRIGASASVPKSPPWIFARPFQFAIASIMVVLLGGAGTVFAAQSALPSDLLYPVKTASEQALLAVVPPIFKGSVALMIADRRAQEV